MMCFWIAFLKKQLLFSFFPTLSTWDELFEQVIASNLQAISNKSRWAFASYQNDVLVKKVGDIF